MQCVKGHDPERGFGMVVRPSGRNPPRYFISGVIDSSYEELAEYPL